MGNAVSNIIDQVNIDMQEAGNEPVRITAGSSANFSSRDNTITGIVIQNVVAAKYAVRLDDYNNNNYIEVTNLKDSTHTNVCLFGTNTNYNRVRLQHRKDTEDPTFTLGSGYYTNNGGSGNLFMFTGGYFN
jgi:hypothetical protein